MNDSRSLEELCLVHKVEPKEIVDTFDCGDADLNDFIKNSATSFRKQLLAVTYVLASRENPNDVIPFYEKNGFHLLDDKEIDKSDLTRIMYFDLKRIS